MSGATIDLIVAGAGPAGLVTATHAARAGLEVTVVDRRRGPIDKACGEGLMPHTVAQLTELGIPLRGKPFRGISYLDEARRVDADFRSGWGMGVRRTVLHEALQDAARDAGARIIRADVGEVSQDAESVVCGQLRGRYLAAADGLHSPIRRTLGLDRPAGRRRRWGIRRHFRTDPWNERVEVYWAPESEVGEAYVTPVADDCVGVAILTSRQGGFDEQLGAFPALAARLRGLEHGSDRAAGPLRQRVAGRVAGRVMLVGDAAGYVDALTGEGLGIAFGAAELVVQSVLADDPEGYDRRWRRMSRRYRALTAGLLHASGFAPARSMIVPAASALPGAFRGIVNLLAS
ncbi:MAG: NAD(P)/FAD-dependent oxidoreductase [Mycobacterium sp.]